MALVWACSGVSAIFASASRIVSARSSNPGFGEPLGSQAIRYNPRA